MKKYLLLILPVLLILTGCPKDDPIKPDPCAGKTSANAEFEIYEVPTTQSSIKFGWIYYDTDTSLRSTLKFKAKYNNDDYKWYIGSEIISESTFIRQKFPKGISIPITLITYKKKDSLCINVLKEYDTLTRYIYFAKYKQDTTWEVDMISGIYRGANLDKIKDTFDIFINVNYKNPDEKFLNYPVIRINNLIPNWDYFDWDEWDLAYKEFYFKDIKNYNYLTPEGIAIISGIRNDTLTINYSIQMEPGWQNFNNRIKKIFKGVRVK